MPSSTSTSDPTHEVVILGSGVIGLTIAYILSQPESGRKAYKITIVARDLPEDFSSQAWATPWAGANWSPIGGFDERSHRWETATFNKFWDMIPTGMVMSLPSRIYYHSEDAVQSVWYQNLVRDFRVLPPSEVPSQYKAGIAFTTLSVNPTIYIPWLKSELDSRGVHFVRRHVASLDEVAGIAGDNAIIVNATSLGARSLIGVEDTNMYPVRGQTLLVYAPGVKGYFSEEVETAPEDGLVTYIIPRPGPDDTVLLGGTYQIGSWDTSLDVPTAHGIFARCAALAPALREDPRTRVLAHGVGLRPARKSGPRVEVEEVELPLEDGEKGQYVPRLTDEAGKLRAKRKIKVVHAYGFGPAGYQNSWGAAAEAVSLVKLSRA